MIVNPPSAIDLAYGYSSATLSQFQGANWKANFPQIQIGFDLVDNQLVPPADPNNPQLQFTGSAYCLPPSPQSGSDQLIVFGTGSTSVNFAFYGASFYDRVTQEEPVFYEFLGYSGNPPAGAKVIKLFGQPALIVSFPATLSVAQAASVPQAFANNLASLFGNDWQSQLTVMGVTLELQLTSQEVQLTPGSVLAPSSMAANYATDAKNLAAVVGTWMSQTPQPALGQMTLVYVATTAQAQNIYTSQVLLPTAVGAAILPEGVLSGLQTTVPPSLLIACGITSPLPPNLITAVPDSGQLFSINQLTANGIVPFQWPNNQPTACVAMSPALTANLVFAGLVQIPAFMQTVVPCTMDVNAVTSGPGDGNWEVALGANLNNLNAFPGQPTDPSSDAGVILNWDGPTTSYTASGEQYDWSSSASISSSPQITASWQTSGNSVNIALSYVFTFDATTTPANANTFIEMGEPASLTMSTAFVLYTSTQPWPCFKLEQLAYTNSPLPQLTVGSQAAISSAMNCLENIISNFQQVNCQFSCAPLGAIGIVGDLGCSMATPLIDEQYRVNAILTPSNS